MSVIVALAAAPSGVASAVPPAHRAASSALAGHQVFVCVKTVRLWQRPGKAPVGLLHRGDAFRITRYSPSRRWALGTGQMKGTSFRPRGWAPLWALCRHRPTGS